MLTSPKFGAPAHVTISLEAENRQKVDKLELAFRYLGNYQ